MTWAEQAVLWIHNQTGPNSLLYFRNIQIYASAVWQTSFSLTFYLFRIVFTLLFWRVFFFFFYISCLSDCLSTFSRAFYSEDWVTISNSIGWKGLEMIPTFWDDSSRQSGLQIRSSEQMLDSVDYNYRLQALAPNSRHGLSVINMLKNIGCKNHIMGPHLNTLQVTESLK